MIRLENNRIDKILVKEYLKEIEFVVKNIEGLDDINSYRKEFEAGFARFLGAKYALAVNSGTDALQLALLALGIGKGDAVIIPDLTYISTALVVKYVLAEPILVDVKKEDLTIDEAKIEKAITPNTKAIIAVHMFGHPCNMGKLRVVAQKHNLYLIEDSCQALGSAYKDKYVGTFSDISAFSFSYYKPLSSLAGNGGMLVFNNNAYKDRIEKFINLWKTDISLLEADRKFNKISLTDIATVKIKLKYINQIIESRNNAKKLYEENLLHLRYIEVFKDTKGFFSVRENYHILAKDRDKLHAFLKKKGIDAELPYPPMHTLKLFRKQNNTDFKITEDYYNRGLHLPLYSFIKKEEMLEVVEAIREFYQ